MSSATSRCAWPSAPKTRNRAGGIPLVTHGSTDSLPPPATVDSVTYAVVEDVPASWERYARYAAALAAGTPQGLIVSGAGPTDEGFRIIEIWESEDAWTRFRASRPADAELAIESAVRTLELAHVVRRAEHV